MSDIVGLNGFITIDKKTGNLKIHKNGYHLVNEYADVWEFQMNRINNKIEY